MKTQKTIEELQERNAKWILAIFFIVFFALAYITQGQTQLMRQKSYDYNVNKPVTTIFPYEPIMFYSPINMVDTMFLSIQADSIGGGAYGITLYSYLPKNINATGHRVFMDFDNGVRAEFDPIKPNGYEINPFNENYFKYQITESTLKLLTTRRCVRVVFEGVSSYAIQREGEYFKDFLACYYK